MRTLVALAVVLVTAQTPTYRADIEAFRKNREAEIGGPTGWAALAGLHWLTPGTHTIGRASDNAVVLDAPSAPDHFGTLTVRADGATLVVAGGVRARVKGAPVTTVELEPGTPSADGVVVGGMTMVLIKRGDRVALRVWDEKSPGRVAFTGLRWYPIDPAWRIDATWVPHAPAPTVKIINVLGELVDMPNVGYAEFSVGGQTFRLEAFLESPNAKELFFMFRDATSGKDTYVAGRYLYSPLPENGRVVLDFNEAKNPPCAFTDFATCPLPPPKNRLPIQVRAGELNHKH
jgi:uncharacterized protein (DUF1684 family)